MSVTNKRIINCILSLILIVFAGCFIDNFKENPGEKKGPDKEVNPPGNSDFLYVITTNPLQGETGISVESSISSKKPPE